MSWVVHGYSLLSFLNIWITYVGFTNEGLSQFHTETGPKPWNPNLLSPSTESMDFPILDLECASAFSIKQLFRIYFLYFFLNNGPLAVMRESYLKRLSTMLVGDSIMMSTNLLKSDTVSISPSRRYRYKVDKIKAAAKCRSLSPNPLPPYSNISAFKHPSGRFRCTASRTTFGLT